MAKGAQSVGTPASYAPPAPPTAANAAATQAAADAKQKALAKEGLNDTILGSQASAYSWAGAFAPKQQGAGKPTLLGGG